MCHGGVTRRLVDTLAHVGYHVLQGGMTVGSGIQVYTNSSRNIQCYIEGCGLMHTDPILGHIAQSYAGLCSE